ncbi:hypothetical protein LWI28_004317 [Acer negundo]|uniref:Uncharacterized protein n=1 Tax=Acer negundo TaxID=4023 RepID=A0AAD5IC36_ACENE|nr:hypothetical protein LWI28_004317 [Acer negundo]
MPHEGVGDGLATSVGDVLTEAFVDKPDEDRNRISKVNEECDEALIGESIDKAGERRNKGKQIAEEDISEEDITVDDFQREEYGSSSDIDSTSDDFRSLDGTDYEKDKGRKSRKFIKIKYHEFDPGSDIGNSIFRIGMLFANDDDFRKAIRAYAVKHRQSYYRAKTAARELIQGYIKDQYSKLWEYGEECMKRMRSESVVTYEWLADKDAHHWLVAYFKNITVCDMLCNNMCEAFNKAILEAYDKPVITFMEMIRNYLLKRLVKKRAELEKWTYDIGPNVFRIVEKLKIESSICQPE